MISRSAESLGDIGQVAVSPSGAAWGVQALKFGSTLWYSASLTRVPAGDLTYQSAVIGPLGTAMSAPPAVAAAGEKAYAARTLNAGGAQLYRYDSDVALDPTFGTGGTVDLHQRFGSTCAVSFAPSAQPASCTYRVASLAADSFGRLLVLLEVVGNSQTRLAVLRLTEAGAADTTYGSGGVAALAAGPTADRPTIAVDVAGRSNISWNASPAATFDRLDAAGAPDLTFGSNGRAAFTSAAGSYECRSIWSPTPLCAAAPLPDGSLAFSVVEVAGAARTPVVGLVSSSGELESVREYCDPTLWPPVGPTCVFLGSLTALDLDGETHLVGIENTYGTTRIPVPFPSGGTLRSHSVARVEVSALGELQALKSVAASADRSVLAFGATVNRAFPPSPNQDVQLLGRLATRVDRPVSGSLAHSGGKVPLGAPFTVDYSCENAAKCALVQVDGELPSPTATTGPNPRTLADGQLITTTDGVATVLLVAITDDVNAPVLLDAATFTIGAPTVTGTTEDGGTFVTGAAATVADPIVTSVRTPIGGDLSVREAEEVGSVRPGFEWYPASVQVQLPWGSTTAESPAEVTVRIHRSLLAGTSASAIAVGSWEGLAPICTGDSPAAATSQGACVKSRRSISGNVAEIVVLTSSNHQKLSFGRAVAGVPGPVTEITAYSAPGAISVQWSSLPLEQSGGATVTTYRATATPVSTPGGVTATTRTATTRTSEWPDHFLQLTGLVQGVTYAVSVEARNEANSSWGARGYTDAPILVPAVPPAPPNISVLAGIKAARVSWDAPEPDGEYPSHSYIVVASAERRDGSVHQVRRTVSSGASWVAAPTSVEVTGLLSGLTYSFTVQARSGVGFGVVSPPTAPVTLSGVPSAPSDVSAVPGIKSAAVSWSAPDSAEPIDRYSVVATADAGDGTEHRVQRNLTSTGDAAEPLATSLVVTGLRPGLSYTFTVAARSAAGTSAASDGSAAVTLSNLPGVPAGVSALAGARSAVVTWDEPPSDELIDKYSVVATAQRQDGTIHRVLRYVNGIAGSGATPSTSLVVSGLTVGLEYSFTVSASSAVGTGAASAPTGPVVPTLGISVAGASVAEGRTAQKALTFVVKLTDPHPVPITVDVATAHGTADDTDYVPLSSTVTFAAGETTHKVTVFVRGDTTVEENEEFYLDLSNPSAGTLTARRGIGTIRNDDV